VLVVVIVALCAVIVLNNDNVFSTSTKSENVGKENVSNTDEEMQNGDSSEDKAS